MNRGACGEGAYWLPTKRGHWRPLLHLLIKLSSLSDPILFVPGLGRSKDYLLCSAPRPAFLSWIKRLDIPSLIRLPGWRHGVKSMVLFERSSYAVGSDLPWSNSSLSIPRAVIHLLFFSAIRPVKCSFRSFLPYSLVLFFSKSCFLYLHGSSFPFFNLRQIHSIAGVVGTQTLVAPDST